MARGVAVFDVRDLPADLKSVSSERTSSEELEGWLAERGQALTGSTDDLVLVDSALDDWVQDPEIAPALDNEVGMYLGDVLVQHVEGARWHVWPNGHPIVRTESGHEYDVTALVSQRVRQGKPLLPAGLEQARAR
ncbi:DUF6278 family protein [Rhodococcus sp. X156]|uniref:DUF6278 family protein n=1 Tax=Rhodococcus sp. X156 TaxID=2499145 RepID=UPI000FDCAECE|nr:DUF6278 family protein [Rhodococcus sp. X156]